MNKFLVSALLVVSMALTACGGDSKKEKADKFVAKLNAFAPNGYVVSKLNTERGGNWVVIGYGGGSAFSAINLDLVDLKKDVLTIINELTAAGVNGGESVTKVSPTSNVYIGASGFVYEESVVAAKDLEKVGAVFEGMQMDAMAQSLAANYGLSEDRSFQVAKLAMSWNKLSKARAMTDADAEAFSTDLVGVNLSQAEAAFAQAQAGDGAQFEALISQAAAVNGVSPEQMSRIVSEVIVSQ